MGKNHKYRNEILNHRFGMLVAIEFAGQTQHAKRTLWRCKCDCGKEKIVRSDCLRGGGTTSCGCKLYRRGCNNPHYKGVGELSKSYTERLRRDAEKRHLEFTITPQFLFDLFKKQNGRCALSGLEICLSVSPKQVLQTASVDRIDSTRGYTPNNVQWVDKRINFMKQALSQKEFLILCATITKNQSAVIA